MHVAFKSGQGHQNWYESVTLDVGYNQVKSEVIFLWIAKAISELKRANVKVFTNTLVSCLVGIGLYQG